MLPSTRRALVACTAAVPSPPTEALEADTPSTELLASSSQETWFSGAAAACAPLPESSPLVALRDAASAELPAFSFPVRKDEACAHVDE